MEIHDSPIIIDNPFLALVGASCTEWFEGYCEFHLPIGASMLNRQRVLQGGVISTLLDVACGYSGLYNLASHEPVHGRTVSLALNFLNSGTSGTVIAKGFLEQRGRSLYFARGEAWLDHRVLLATAQGSFKVTRQQ